MEDAAIDSNTEEYSSDKMSGILNKGLELGKKILISGFVISSAPLVLPPLLVISAVGAVSLVPSGFFLASYVCAEKLMSQLLPGTTPPSLLFQSGTLYNDDDHKVDRDGVQRGKDDTKGTEELDEGMALFAVDNGQGSVEEDEEEKQLLEEIEVEVEGIKEEEQEEPVTEKRKDEQPVDDSDANNVKQKPQYDRDTESAAGQDNTSTKSGAPEGEQASYGSQFSSQRDISTTSNEVLYSEEKIWKKIDAMRNIVGYKAVRSETCIEELKALYLFTGVEPAASFENQSDLVEVNDKLGFLMSVVGVK